MLGTAEHQNPEAAAAVVLQIADCRIQTAAVGGKLLDRKG